MIDCFLLKAESPLGYTPNSLPFGSPKGRLILLSSLGYSISLLDVQCRCHQSAGVAYLRSHQPSFGVALPISLTVRPEWSVENRGSSSPIGYVSSFLPSVAGKHTRRSLPSPQSIAVGFEPN